MSANLTIVPIALGTAKKFVADHHRHHNAPVGHKFSIGLLSSQGLVGVAIIGRPVSRLLDDGTTAEVTRLATLGIANGCSALYAAAWRASKGMGYRRLITYTQAQESGASPRGAGMREVAHRPARPGWDTPSRPRQALGTEQVERILWEICTSNAPPLPADLSDAMCDETRPRQCDRCRRSLAPRGAGRPASYCSHACRQAAYRARRTVAA